MGLKGNPGADLHACTSCMLRALMAVPIMQGEATIPSTLQMELDTNPFLRPQDPDIRTTLRIPADAADVDAFTVIRKAKDKF